jgi:2-isopropylmalate synthase
MQRFDHRKYRPFAPLVLSNRQWPNRVITQAPTWCSVDLRDGNQALIQPMDVTQKLRLFEQLVQIGFKEIEVGFPAASQPDFDFVRRIIEQGHIPSDVTIQVLTQARPELITRTYEALAGARRAIVHVYNSTNRVQREQVFGLDRDGVKAIAVNGARAVQAGAKAYPQTQWIFQYSPESFSGTEMAYAVEVCDAVIDVWQPQHGQGVIINLPATVEMSTPNVFADQVEWFCNHVQQRQHIRVSVHTHNDRGCAVAASELAVTAGADRVEGTLMGNGERTGNMDIVTMAMNLYSQGIDPQLDLSHLQDIIQTVEACTRIEVHPRHPYAGELVFTAFSGSHQDAIRKGMAQYREADGWQVPYLPIDPRDVGRRYDEVVRINSQSGKGGVTHILERDYGVTLPRWMQLAFSKVVQQHAEQSGAEVSSVQIWQLFQQAFSAPQPQWVLHRYDVHRDGALIQATIEAGSGATRVRFNGEGHGVIEALVHAIHKQRGIAVVIEHFDEMAMRGGTDAEAMACVRLRLGEDSAIGVACAEDTTTATLQAVLTAVSQVVQVAQAAQSQQVAN